MIGEKFVTENNSYTITEELAADDRPNANIYLCVDDQGKEYVAKYFYNLHPVANVAYSKNNHFGRRRDGSETVFEEINAKSQDFDFIVKHLDRGKYNRKTFIIMEYIEGDILYDFLASNYDDNNEAAIKAIHALAETLAIWHRNGFAHGDPHLENAILQKLDAGQYLVKLIDYSQIHHEDFYYCQQYDCFSPDPNRRTNEDLKNNFNGKLGEGFEIKIIELQNELGADNTLIDEFKRIYKERMAAVN